MTWISQLALARIAAGLLLMLAAPVARAATPKQIDEMIEKGKARIYKEEQNGTWESIPVGEHQETAVTAMMVYALLATGESPQDLRLASAIKFLVATPTIGVYALSLRCSMWASLPQPYKKDVRDAFERDVTALLNGGHPDATLVSTPSLFYAYTTAPQGSYNHSTSQYGVLGVWAAAEAGAEVPVKYWQAVDAGWRAQQHKNGAWSYSWSVAMQGHETAAPLGPHSGFNDDTEPRVSMTSAGVTILFITQEYLHGMDGIDCVGNIEDPAIEAGIKWIGDNFNSVYDKIANNEYGLYGIERVALASGRKYFGDVDWYQNGADYLLKNPDYRGGWGSVTETAFGILFLERGRAPVVMNKLQYELNMHGDKAKIADWNQRPRDAANITKWIGKENERLLNWQVVNLKVPVEDLHDAPILYITGNQALDFTDEELAKLRQFVEEGGLIFANADCGSLAFSQGFRKVCHKLFGDYEFRELPASSPIYTNEQFMRVKWQHKFQVEALSNGARELAILVPTADPARFWQTQTVLGREELHQFFDDVFLYTVERGEKGGVAHKGESYIVRPDANIHPAKTIKVARLEYPGNWNPEPGSWRRLAAILHNTGDTDLAITSIKLGEGKLDKSFPVAHLTGTFKFSLTPAARDEIRKYVDGGGTLIVDACGGDAGFAESAQKEIAAIFPADALPAAPLALESPVYAGDPKLDRVEYRSFTRKVVGTLSTPRIRALTLQGRPAIFFSAEDLSCGMVGMAFDGIYGYQPASATTLMEKLVLFAGK